MPIVLGLQKKWGMIQFKGFKVMYFKIDCVRLFTMAVMHGFVFLISRELWVMCDSD
jgi:hypothetical protein